MKKLLLIPAMISSVTIFAQNVVKKVIIEDYTGTWCGWCPEGTVILEQIEAANHDKMFAIANHNGDRLETTEGAAIVNELNIRAYPSGTVDRFKFPSQPAIRLDRGNWNAFYRQRSATPAIASVSFSNLQENTSTNTYKGKINIEFTSLPTEGVPITVQLYILEDSIKAEGVYRQGNSSPNVQGGANPLTNWYHNHTLRKALGGDWGWSDVIPATPQVGVKYSKDFEFVIPAEYVAKNVHFLAFVAYNGSVADNQKEIINSEQIYTGQFKSLGINDVTTSKNELGIYPNLVGTSDQVNVTYNLTNSGDVTINIYDYTGKLIATPYKSYETAGYHTVNFYGSNHNLTSGMYIIQVTSGNEVFTGKLSIK